MKDGKEVKDENGYSYKLVDGFIINTHGKNFHVGDNISSIYNPYILEEEESLKIEVGKWYETRNHKKARCFLIDGSDCFFTIDNYTSLSTNKHGYRMEEEPDDLDIIGPWEEDKK